MIVLVVLVAIFSVAFLLLCVDVVRAMRLFHPNATALVMKHAAQVPNPSESRIFCVYCKACVYHPDDRTLILTLMRDERSDKLSAFMGNGQVLCVVDSYVFYLSLRNRSDEDYVLKASRLTENTKCFSQCTAYDALDPSRLANKTLVLLSVSVTA